MTEEYLQTIDCPKDDKRNDTNLENLSDNQLFSQMC